MRIYLTIISLTCTLLISCAKNYEIKISDKKITLKSYNQITEYENQFVSASGFLSKTHGASGLYFNLKDLDDENGKCITLSQFVEEEHGARLELTGKLVASECSKESICTNICSDYELLVSSNNE